MQAICKVLFSQVLKILLFPFYMLKIKKNRVVFTGQIGGNDNEYCCNPRYVCEELLKEYKGEYEIFWAVGEPDRYKDLEKKGIHLVRHYSWKSFLVLLTARVIVTNGSYAPWFPFRKKQYLINTWHGGGAYKKIENSKPDANWATRKRAQFCAKNIKLFISSCEKASQELIRGSFCYDGEIMECGMPRNDFLVRQELKEAQEAVRKYYNLEKDTRILLYAPTYRQGETEVSLDADDLLKFLDKDGEKWVFLYRSHRYQNDSMKLTVSGKRVLPAAKYPDMQELLAAADMMITDYSSNIWDYSFLYRPCFLYVPDLEEYLQKTGFYVDIHQWPFEMAGTQEELKQKIAACDRKELKARIEAHHRFMGSRESGNACKMIVNRIRRVCQK